MPNSSGTDINIKPYTFFGYPIAKNQKIRYNHSILTRRFFHPFTCVFLKALGETLKKCLNILVNSS